MVMMFALVRHFQPGTRIMLVKFSELKTCNPRILCMKFNFKTFEKTIRTFWKVIHFVRSICGYECGNEFFFSFSVKRLI